MVSDSALCLQTGYCALGGLSDAKLFLSTFKGLWVDRRDGLPSRSTEPRDSPVPTLSVPSTRAAAPGSLLTSHLAGPSGLDDTHPKTCKHTLLLSSALWGHPSSTTLSSQHLLCVLQKRLKKKKKEKAKQERKAFQKFLSTYLYTHKNKYLIYTYIHRYICICVYICLHFHANVPQSVR